MSTEAKLCAGNCGFYGSPQTEDMCSVCFKKVVEEREARALAELKAKEMREKEEEERKAKEAEEAKKREAGKCFHCKRHLRPGASFMCKCDHEFCGKHRYAEEHDCTFDYKTHARQILVKNNPLVKSSKVDYF